MKVYKINKAYYEGSKIETILLPDNIELLESNDVAGHLQYEGFFNYLGIAKGDYTDNENMEESVGRIGDYTLYSLRNIQFIDEHPSMLDAEEFNKKYNLSNNIIVHWGKDYCLDSLYRIKYIENEFGIYVDKLTVNYVGYGRTTVNADTCHRELDELLLPGQGVKVKVANTTDEKDNAENYWVTCMHMLLDEFKFFERGMNCIYNKPNNGSLYLTVNINVLKEMFKGIDFFNHHNDPAFADKLKEFDNIINLRKVQLVEE